MRIVKTKTYEEMSAIAAGIIGGQVLLKPNCVLGLATGSSPIGTYKDLVKSYEDGILDFSEVRTVNLDEYCGLDDANPNSYRYFMNDNLFDHVNIDKANTHVPNGHADDLEEEAVRYESFIQSLGDSAHRTADGEHHQRELPFVRAPRGCADAGHHHGHRHHYEGEEDSSHRRPG